MEIVTFIDAQGHKLYCLGPFNSIGEARQASRASASAREAPRKQAGHRKRDSAPITKRCHQIFDLLAEKSRLEKIAECKRQGINPGTAATQYNLWRKARA